MVQLTRLNALFLFMKKLWKVPVSFLFIFSFPLSCSQNRINLFSVYDGDTFIDNSGQRIRIFGIDAPEIKESFGIKKLFAIKSRNFLNQLLNKSNIEILFLSKGYYGRSVCRVLADKKDVATTILKNGLAIVKYVSINPKNKFYSSDFEYYNLLLNAQYYAFENKLGIWSKKELLKKIFNKR